MLHTILLEEMKLLRSHIVQRIEASGKKATGYTSDTLRTDVAASGNEIQATLYGADYLGTLERGRPPSKGRSSGKNSEFTASLRQWIVAKGIPYQTDGDLERLARFFQWYISKHGDRLYRSGQQNDITQTPIQQFEERINQRITSKTEQQLTQLLSSLL